MGDERGETKKKSRVRRVVRWSGLGLLGWAVAHELRQPKEQRTWQGTLGGFIPYDLRVPTMERMREAYWAPENPRIFTPRPMGVGWAVNVGRLVKSAKSRT